MGINVLISALITVLVVILIVYLVDRLPVDGRMKQIIRLIVILIGILSLLRLLNVFTF